MPAVNQGELKHYLDQTRRAAQAAGELLSRHFGSLGALTAETKSTPVDLVSVADRESEELLRGLLGAIVPGAGFLGEESDYTKAEAGDLTWVVDPLDGTSNFLAGLPIWCISIGLCGAGLVPLVGVVHSPPLGRTWTAGRGLGAWQNGAPVQVRRDPPGGGLQNAVLATGFPYDMHSPEGQRNLRYYATLQTNFQKIRRMGSAAIDLALVASGIFDGLWELGLKAWDTAAGMLLIEEAGGQCCRIDGSSYTPGDADLVAAATPELLAEIRAELLAAMGGA